MKEEYLRARIADMELHDRLAAAGHWSPFEHPAQAIEGPPFWHGNFKGWKQYRKFFPTKENRKVDLEALLEERKRIGTVYAKGPQQ